MIEPKWMLITNWAKGETQETKKIKRPYQNELTVTMKMREMYKHMTKNFGVVPDFVNSITFYAVVRKKWGPLEESNHQQCSQQCQRNHKKQDGDSVESSFDLGAKSAHNLFCLE